MPSGPPSSRELDLVFQYISQYAPITQEMTFYVFPIWTVNIHLQKKSYNLGLSVAKRIIVAIVV